MVKKSFILIVAALTVFVGLVTATLAWFGYAHSFDPDVSGDAITGYFAGGDGLTKETAYLITEPIHVYNLAWLQYMGMLNQDVGSDGKIIQYHFVLGQDIDMGDMILPPIGTERYPFIGHFDGQGYCLRDLTVSNYIGGNEHGISTRPLTVIDMENVDVVGFFGIIGDYNGQYGDNLTEKKTDQEGNEYTVNAVHDLFLDSLTVRTESTRSLIGLFAGFVNGTVDNVGIGGESSLQIGAGTLPLGESDIIDALVKEDFTEDQITKLQQVISMHSVIGGYDGDSIFWGDYPTEDDDGETDIPDGDGDSGWGGSINILEIKKRVAYIVGAVGLKSAGTFDYYLNTESGIAYGYKGWFRGKSAYSYYQVNSRQSQVKFLKGTVMPISIDRTIFDSGETNESVTGEPTLPYYIDNRTLDKEPVVLTNSGYLVGGGDATDNNKNQYIEICTEYPLGYSMGGRGVYKSFGTAYSHRAAFPEYKDSLGAHFLTVTPGGQLRVIQDDYNTAGGSTSTYFSANSGSYTFESYTSLGFEKYIQKDDSGVDLGVRTSFLKANSQEQFLHSIIFKNKINLTSLEKTTADVTINNTVKTSYEMIDGAINFSLNSAGVCTVVAGTYSYNDENVSNKGLFSIFHLTRDPATNKISSVQKISAIYKRLVPQAGQDKFVYQYEGMSGTYSETEYKLVYHYNNMKNLSEPDALYYFEIPLNSGDYAIGATTSDPLCAQFLYLDIGASGNQDDTVGPGPDDGEDTEKPFHNTISNITFVHDAIIQMDNEARIANLDLDPIVFEIYLKNANNQSHAGLDVRYKRTAELAMTYKVSNETDFEVIPIYDSSKFGDTGVSKETYTPTAALSYGKRRTSA